MEKMKYSLSPSLMIFFSGFHWLAGRGRSCQRCAFHHEVLGRVALKLSSGSLGQSVELLHRHLRQLGDLLHEVDRAHHQPDVRVVVLLAAMVVDADETLHARLRFILIGNRQVIRLPGDAAREIGDLDLRLSIEIALHVPVEHLRLVVRESRVKHLQLVGAAEELQLDRRWIDQRVRPRKLQRVHALSECHGPRFAHQRDVLAVVNRQLHAVAIRNRREIHIPRGRIAADECG